MENGDKGCRAGVREIVTEHCAGCGEEKPISGMIVWRDEMWCVDCACESATDELLPPAAQLDRELAAVRSESAVARRRDAKERAGVYLVRDSSETAG